MIPQSFKIIWKQRRYNGLIMIEIVFSFIALFALASVVLTYTKRYQQPFGMNNKNIWIIRAWPSGNAAADNRLSDSIILIKRDLIKKHLKSNYSEIKEVSMMTNQDIPYGRSMSFNCTNFKKKQICYHRSLTEPDFYKTFDIKLLEGRWVSPEDALSGILTVVINKKLKQEFFGNQQAAGKTIYIDDKKPRPMKVVGIFEAIKRQGEFNEEPNFMFESFQRNNNNPFHGFAIKLKENIDKTFEARLMKDLESFDRSFEYRLERIETMRSEYIRNKLAPLIIVGSIVLFLIVNVMLGLFGMLWLNISRRKSEIGLRMAVGSSSAKVLWQLLGETYGLALVAITIGLVFTSQMFIFNVYNIPVVTLVEANLAAMFLILLFCTLSAYTPGKLAARLQPAEALHEE